MANQYEGNVGELTVGQVKELDLTLEGWNKLLEDEQSEDGLGRVGVVEYATKQADALLMNDFERSDELEGDESLPALEVVESGGEGEDTPPVAPTLEPPADVDEEVEVELSEEAKLRLEIEAAQAKLDTFKSELAAKEANEVTTKEDRKVLSELKDGNGNAIPYRVPGGPSSKPHQPKQSS